MPLDKAILAVSTTGAADDKDRHREPCKCNNLTITLVQKIRQAMTMRHRGRYTYTFAASFASPADGWFWRAQARCRQWPKRPVKARLEELSVRLSFKYFQNMHEISFEWSAFI